jgi:hypothetical protein
MAGSGQTLRAAVKAVAKAAVTAAVKAVAKVAVKAAVKAAVRAAVKAVPKVAVKAVPKVAVKAVAKAAKAERQVLTREPVRMPMELVVQAQQPVVAAAVVAVRTPLPMRSHATGRISGLVVLIFDR